MPPEVPVFVGNNGLTNYFSEPVEYIWTNAWKVRHDTKPIQVMHIEQDQDPAQRVPVVSWSLMTDEFTSLPDEDEMRMDEAIDRLRDDAEIEAFKETGQHAFVLYRDLRNDSVLTPEALTEILQSADPRRNMIMMSLDIAIKESKKTSFAQHWIEAMVRVYHSG